MTLTYGISRVRDEDDLIGWSLRRAIQQYDHVIIGEGNSSDNTREIIEKIVAEGAPVTLLDDFKVSVEQRDVMTEYAHLAREMGAEWVCPYDTDEAWYGLDGPVARTLDDIPESILIANVANVTHCSTTEDDWTDPDPMSRMKWRSKEKLPLAKVACRTNPLLRIGHGNHDATYDGVRHVPRVDKLIVSHHFPYRTAEQFAKRVAIAYPQLRDSGLPRSHGLHMWLYGEVLDNRGPEGLHELFNEHMLFDRPAENADLEYDPLPPLE